MGRTAIILAGGHSKRFGQDKGLIELAGKPLILHVIDRVSELVNETLVVVSSKGQKAALAALSGSRTEVVTDKCNSQSPLVGALTGFENASHDHSVLLPCDTPFVSKEIISLLFDLCSTRDAAIPRWTNRYIEPLHAVYHTKSALDASEKAYGDKELDLRSMIANLRRVRYISTLVLRQIDPKLITFFNVNIPEDLMKAESMSKRLNTPSFLTSK